MNKFLFIGVVLVVLCLVGLAGCGGGGYEGTWILPGQSGSIIIQSDGTGTRGAFGNTDSFTWQTEGSGIKMISVRDPEDVGYATLSSDGNLQLFATATSTEPPFAILVRQKD